MELWDGYDENGNKLGIDLVRGETIPQGVYHLVCQVIVRHRDGDFLLMLRDGKKTHPYKYECSAGGSVLKGENPHQAMHRELKEETGLSAASYFLLGWHVEKEKQSIYFSFLAIVDTLKENIILQEGETINYKWLDYDSLCKFIDTRDFIQGEYKKCFIKNLAKVIALESINN